MVYIIKELTLEKIQEIIRACKSLIWSDNVTEYGKDEAQKKMIQMFLLKEKIIKRNTQTKGKE